MENSLLAIFDEIPCTIIQGLWPNFRATLKNSILIGINSNFLHNVRISNTSLSMITLFIN